jgi:hypothetical protein
MFKCFLESHRFGKYQLGSNHRNRRYAGENMKNHHFKIFIVIFYSILSNSIAQIIGFSPNVDTLFTAGGCTPTQIVASYRYCFENIDTLQITPDWNTSFWSGSSFWSSRNIYYDKVYFLINDSLKQYKSELLIRPVDNYQKTPISVPFDSVTNFDFRKYYIRLVLRNNDNIIDSLSQFCIALIGMGITEKTGSVSDCFQLLYNYPNPFNLETIIKYNIAKASKTQILIFNIYGQLIDLLVDDIFSPGIYSTKWKADKLVSGQYIIILKSDDRFESRKCLLLK